MGADFVISNNYVWGKSEKLVERGVLPGQIRSTMAWYKLYGTDSSPEYVFSFSSPKTEPEYLKSYTLDEEKDLSFPGSIFVNPKVYLYKKK